jgi:hypothetical protein
VNLFRFVPGYETSIYEAGREPIFVALLAFLICFLVALVVLAAPLYHRWYRHMRRPDAEDRGAVHTYPPPAPGAAWAGGPPELRLDDEGSSR